jgi:alkanesulfonate monooxygenase SsuD/methylene tetrahydromethanopterin reductase-like flavin-dependent oxidoreductase (luciferase family)
MHLAARHAQTWITAGPPATFDARPYAEALPQIAAQLRAVDDACVAVGRDPATLRRLLLTGAAVGGVLASAEAWRDAAGRFAEVGVTDLVVHWPRADFPYAGDENVLADIAADLTGAPA